MRKSLIFEIHQSIYNPEQVRSNYTHPRRKKSQISRGQLKEDIFGDRMKIHLRPMRPVDEEFRIEREY